MVGRIWMGKIGGGNASRLMSHSSQFHFRMQAFSSKNFYSLGTRIFSANMFFKCFQLVGVVQQCSQGSCPFHAFCPFGTDMMFPKSLFVRSRANKRGSSIFCLEACLCPVTRLFHNRNPDDFRFMDEPPAVPDPLCPCRRKRAMHGPRTHDCREVITSLFGIVQENFGPLGSNFLSPFPWVPLLGLTHQSLPLSSTCPNARNAALSVSCAASVDHARRLVCREHHPGPSLQVAGSALQHMFSFNLAIFQEIYPQ